MTNEWLVYGYEVDMFKRTLELCGRDTLASYSRPIQNAIVESLLLHTRILVDILLSRGIDPDNDGITLKTLLPDFEPSRLGELKDRYGNGKTVDSPCWTINKRLAHSTTVRTEGFDYLPKIDPLRPVIQQCLDEVEAERGKRGLEQMKRPEAAVAVAFLNLTTSSQP